MQRTPEFYKVHKNRVITAVWPNFDVKELILSQTPGNQRKGCCQNVYSVVE
jgi:hypothetical protein